MKPGLVSLVGAHVAPPSFVVKPIGAPIKDGPTATPFIESCMATAVIMHSFSVRTRVCVMLPLS